MKQSITRQRGAVLVFSLIMLLLIVLLGVNMVHQNRMQLMMAANTQGQANEFAEAENILKATENYIDSQRYVKGSLPDPAAGEAYDCQTDGGFYNQLTPGLLTEDELAIELLNDSTVEITKTACLNAGNQLEELDCAIDTTTCHQSNAVSNNPCDTEIYTIETTMKDAANNERVLVSRYAVRCDN